MQFFLKKSSPHYDSEQLKIAENLKKQKFSELNEIFWLDTLTYICKGIILILIYFYFFITKKCSKVDMDEL